MEGFPAWFFISLFAVYGCMGIALAPVLVAIGFWLARRPRQALILFASSLLCEAVAWAAFFFVLLSLGLEHGGVEQLLNGLSYALLGLSLLLGGIGQFVAALRSLQTYTVALAFAVAAAAVMVVGTPLAFSFFDRLGLPAEFLGMLPHWDSLPIALTSLPLAAASLMIAVLLPVSRPEKS